MVAQLGASQLQPQRPLLRLAPSQLPPGIPTPRWGGGGGRLAAPKLTLKMNEGEMVS